MTEADKLQCVERELRYRKQVYPRWVAAGKMKAEQAEWQIKVMESIVLDYRKIVNGERLI
jgi:hypothetical protein